MKYTQELFKDNLEEMWTPSFWVVLLIVFFIELVVMCCDVSPTEKY